LPALSDPPLVVGGTGFYIDAIVRGLADLPAAHPEIRDRLAAEERAAPGALHRRLERLDATAAQRIGPANIQRLIRAVEVRELTGGPFSAAARTPTSFRPIILVIAPDRTDLHRRIDERCRWMFDHGLPEEVESLLKRFPPNLPAFSIIGYTEAFRLVRGLCSRVEAVAQTAARTRQLAKRQLTWWRHFRYEQVRFVPAGVSPDGILAVWKESDACGDS